MRLLTRIMEDEWVASALTVVLRTPGLLLMDFWDQTLLRSMVGMSKTGLDFIPWYLMIPLTGAVLLGASSFSGHR